MNSSERNNFDLEHIYVLKDSLYISKGNRIELNFNFQKDRKDSNKTVNVPQLLYPNHIIDQSVDTFNRDTRYILKYNYIG